MEIQIFKKDSVIQLTKDISLKDFQCKCKDCKFVPVNITHLKKVQELMDKLNVVFHINSGRRCCSHNFKVGGEPESFHILGYATDLSLPGDDIHKFQSEFEIFDGVGIYRTFIHCDSRGFQKARWSK